METLKDAIKDRYSKIALESSMETSCCGTTSSPRATGPSSTMSESYEANLVKEFASSDLGLGCGLPTEYADLREGMTVLDLGSGAGIDVFVASKHVGDTGKVIGIDMTEAMVERARRHARELGVSNVEFRLGEIERMPIATGSVDRVISNCVLNLVPDKRTAFAEIYRVLKQGGSFIVSDIVSRGTVPDELQKNRNLWAGCISGAIDLEQYLSIISEAGFDHVEILTQHPVEKIAPDAVTLMSATVKGVK